MSRPPIRYRPPATTYSDLDRLKAEIVKELSQIVAVQLAGLEKRILAQLKPGVTSMGGPSLADVSKNVGMIR